MGHKVIHAVFSCTKCRSYSIKGIVCSNKTVFDPALGRSLLKGLKPKNRFSANAYELWYSPCLVTVHRLLLLTGVSLSVLSGC